MRHLSLMEQSLLRRALRRSTNMNWKTAANISGYSPTKSRNRPRRASYKPSYASPEQPATIVLKFDGNRRSFYDTIDRAARKMNVSRHSIIFTAISTFFEEEKE